MNGTIYFLSDTHFSYHSNEEEESKKQEYFLDFLRRIEGADRLYLVGDIFDFWFEYRSVIPRYYHQILFGLQRLGLSGTKIFICGGNHDYWYGSFLNQTLGITILPRESIHDLQGKKIVITHGDLLMPRDYGYKMLTNIIRSRAIIALARLFHPDLLYIFARAFSRTSKGITQKKTSRSAQAMLSRAENSLFTQGNDTFIMGHVHFPVIRRFGEKTFVILGDWESHYSFLKLRGGVFSLESYQREGNTLSENR
ncbi:MAG: UDP-2,3-diacylglucosamine diphosphatase [Candidatus Krumholzibacteriota bacterium]|nr:UDP-2,3-diacylglucosamine diphosphatase [Candidatus Krumholzibacteriota bacterium]